MLLQTINSSNILLLKNAGILIVENTKNVKLFSGKCLLVTLSQIDVQKDDVLSVITCCPDQLIINITKRLVYDHLVNIGKTVVGNIPPMYKITIRSHMFLGAYRAAVCVGPSSSNNYKGQRILGLYNDYKEANEALSRLEKLGGLQSVVHTPDVIDQVFNNNMTKSYKLR